MFNKVKTQIQVEENPKELKPGVKEEVEDDRSAFNCDSCAGEGLVDGKVCTKCAGTGKI